MKVMIIGPGAMGLLFAARLKRFTNEEVMLLDYKKERADFLNKNGVKVEGIKGDFHVHVPVLLKDKVFVAPDFVMIFVKAYNTRDAAYEIRDIIEHNTVVLTLQNGLGNIEILEEIIERKVYGGITAEGATLLSPGHVRHAGYGDTIIGPFHKGLQDLQDILNRAGFKTEIRDDIEGIVWGKLLINIAINPLTAITGLKNGMLPKMDGTKKIMEGCLREAIEIADKKGIRLPYEDPVKKAHGVCKNTAGNISSMLQDVLAHKPTEIDFLNGAIVREGEKLGIRTPVNSTLTHLVHVIQETYRERAARE